MIFFKRVLAWFGFGRKAKEDFDPGRKPVHSMSAEEVAKLLDYDQDFLFGASTDSDFPVKPKPRDQYSQDGIDAARYFKCIFGTNEQRDLAIRFYRKREGLNRDYPTTAGKPWIYNKDTNDRPPAR